MPQHSRDAGLWKPGTPHPKNAGVWKPARKGHIRDVGLWKRFYARPPALTFLGGFLAQNTATVTINVNIGAVDPDLVILAACGGNSGSSRQFTTCTVDGISGTRVTPAMSGQNPAAVFATVVPNSGGARNVVVNVSGNMEGFGVGIWRAIAIAPTATGAVATNASAAQSIATSAGGLAVGVAGLIGTPTFTAGLADAGTITDPAYGYSWTFGRALGLAGGTMSVDANGLNYPLLAAAAFSAS